MVMGGDTTEGGFAMTTNLVRWVAAVVAAPLLVVAVSGCGATDVIDTAQQCARVGAAVAKVSVVGVGGQATGQDLSAARDALGGLGEVPSELQGSVDSLEAALAEGKGLDDPAVQAAYDQIRTWVEQECVPGSLGDLLPGG
jgi:hypothetical protein